MKYPAFIFITLFFLFSPIWVFAQQSKECLDLILNINDWKETILTKWDYQKNGNDSAAILYIGAEHRDDPSHSQFEKIKSGFQAFKPTLFFTRALIVALRQLIPRQFSNSANQVTSVGLQNRPLFPF